MIAEKNTEIRKAVDTLYELSGNEEVRAEYERRQKAWRDWHSQNEGYYQDGLQKGREEAILEIARKMKEMGLTEEQIITVTGFFPE